MFLLTAATLRCFDRFCRNNRGSAAVEFAFVALPFFILMTSAIDFGLAFFATSTLESGVTEAARRIRTGEVASNGISAIGFRNMVCDEIKLFLTCNERLGIDVRVFNSFGNINFPAALDANGNLAGNFQFQPGTAGDIVLVRVFYAWPMLTPVFGDAVKNMAGGSRLISGTAAFRNEPFGQLLN